VRHLFAIDGGSRLILAALRQLAALREGAVTLSYMRYEQAGAAADAGARSSGALGLLGATEN